MQWFCYFCVLHSCCIKIPKGVGPVGGKDRSIWTGLFVAILLWLLFNDSYFFSLCCALKWKDLRYLNHLGFTLDLFFQKGVMVIVMEKLDCFQCFIQSWKVLEFSSTLNVVVWKVFCNAFWLSKTLMTHSWEELKVIYTKHFCFMQELHVTISFRKAVSWTM